MKEIKIMECFGGIGALTKAFKRLNIPHKVVDYVEIDKYAVKSFNAIHNTNFEPQDITTWDKDIEIDLIMHGSPCQDFSLAGKQAGGDKDSGTRSSLMYETIRIVEKLKPKYVIWENVKNLLSKKHRHNFDAYLKTMEQLGYTNYYQVLNAKDYGIPQNRERVFTISILGNEKYEFPKGNVCNNEIDMVEIPQKVKVRKYEVNTKKLKNVLRNHKKISNKEISKKLNKPITLVEHWFRKDNCFSIPDADIWFELKKLLNIETNEFDEAITTFEEKDNVYEKSNRFYCDTGLAPTITSTSANEKIIQTFTFPPKQDETNLQGFLEQDVNIKTKPMCDKAFQKEYQEIITSDKDIYQCNVKSGYQDCKVGIKVSPTIRANNNCTHVLQRFEFPPKQELKLKLKDMLEDEVDEKYYLSEQAIRGRMITHYQKYKLEENCINGREIHPTILARFEGAPTLYKFDNYRIRKLTPKECWRLMGFDDEDYKKASKVNSNTQLYKQAGNSIVVNVLEAILKNLLF